MSIHEYRLWVIDAVGCPACYVGRTFSCVSLDSGLPVGYVHDDRTMSAELAKDEALSRVRALHYRIQVGESAGFCAGCGYTYPCQTITALDELSGVPGVL